ncbi:hypothetical protein D3C80_1707900 [compost metagenome]
MRDLAAVSSRSGAHRIKHQRYAVRVGGLSGEDHGADGLFIQSADIQHHCSGHGGNIRNLFARIGHKRGGTQRQQPVGGEVGHHNVCNVMYERIKLAYLG